MTEAIANSQYYPYGNQYSQYYGQQCGGQSCDPWQMSISQDIPLGSPYSNCGGGNGMDWYYQNIAPGMQSVSDIYNQEMGQLANNGFNANNVNAYTNKEALQTFHDMLNDPNGPGGSDGILVEQEARDALNDNTGKYTEKQKDALRYILDVKQNSSGVTLWDTLKGEDGIVSNKDIDPTLDQYKNDPKEGLKLLDPNSLTPNCLTPYKG